VSQHFTLLFQFGGHLAILNTLSSYRPQYKRDMFWLEFGPLLSFVD
jgi:hypothetical protein